jgi:hypothetical protein
MMKRFDEFEKRVNRALANMDAKISYLHDATGQVKNTFGEFKDEIGDFMQYMAEQVSDHENRIDRLEKNAGL